MNLIEADGGVAYEPDDPRRNELCYRINFAPRARKFWFQVSARDGLPLYVSTPIYDQWLEARRAALREMALLKQALIVAQARESMATSNVIQLNSRRG